MFEQEKVKPDWHHNDSGEELFDEPSPDHLVASAAGSAPVHDLGRATTAAKRFILGQPISNAEEGEERLSKALALPIFSSDAISSSAYASEEILIVLGTSSSESALVPLMNKLERLGCAKPVVGLVVPSGYSFNLDGTNIYMTLAALFIAQACNVDLSLGQQLLLLGVAMLSSKGAAGVTGAGFITLAATLSVVPEVPVAGMALILGIDRFMSECRALVNLVGNAWEEGNRNTNYEIDANRFGSGDLGDTAFIRVPPAAGPSAVEWIATRNRAPDGSSRTRTSSPSQAARRSSVTMRPAERLRRGAAGALGALRGPLLLQRLRRSALRVLVAALVLRLRHWAPPCRGAGHHATGSRRAGGVGFEPTGGLPRHRFSRPAPSSARPPSRGPS